MSYAGKRQRTSYKSGGVVTSKSYTKRIGTRLKRAKRAALNNRRKYYKKNIRFEGLLGIELKFYDLGLSNYGLNNSTDATAGRVDPTDDCLNGPPQGDTYASRDGKRIAMKSLQIKGFFYQPALEDITDPPAGNEVFLAIVMDTQTNGGAAGSELVFTNALGTAYGAVIPLQAAGRTKRFKILRVERYDISHRNVGVEGNNLHSSAALTIPFEMFIDLKGTPVNFTTSTAAGVAGIVDNSIHVYAWSLQGPTYGTTLSYVSRLRFYG